MRTWAVSVGAILPLALFSQQTPEQPEIISHESPVTFSSRVNLVSVPVVVRDREGRAVGNLRREDFQLYDKGKLQVITKFTVEKTEAPLVEATLGASAVASPEHAVVSVPSKPALPERYLAYLVDDIHLKSIDLLNRRQAMNRHLDESLDPTSRAAIFTTSGPHADRFHGRSREAAQSGEQRSSMDERIGERLPGNQLLHGGLGDEQITGVFRLYE